mgnify:CR=1 FL=1
MKKKIAVIAIPVVVFILVWTWLFALPDLAEELVFEQTPEALARGAYLVTAGGCVSCHRSVVADDGIANGVVQNDAENSGASFSGGFGLETDFGTFYAPNITPDKETGIGNWSAEDFLFALKHGRSPSRSFYYPTFPYRAYAGLSDQDVLDIGSYLMSLEPVRNQVAEPEIPAWLARWTIAGWNKMADFSQLLANDTEIYDDALVARGAYLARNLGHCGECHTPRNGLGIPDFRREYHGAELGDETIEAIDAAALEEWTANNFDLFLLLGLKPNGEFVGGDMNDVIEHNTSKLTDEDRDALAAFFTRSNR